MISVNDKVTVDNWFNTVFAVKAIDKTEAFITNVKALVENHGMWVKLDKLHRI